MNISHIYFDLDGTLLNSDKRISKKTYEYLVAIKLEYGLIYGIATGRNKKSVDRLLDIDDPKGIFEHFIYDNGVTVVDKSNDFYEQSGMININQIKQIIRDYSDTDVTVAFHNKTKFCSSKYSQKVEDIMKLNGVNDHLLLTLDSYFEETERVMLLVDDSIVTNHDFFQYDHLNLIHPVKGVFEYMHKNVSKKEGITLLMKNGNFGSENIMVFGDAENDIDMLKLTKNSVVMKNSTPEIKKYASYTTRLNNDEDGIIDFLQSQENRLNSKRRQV